MFSKIVNRVSLIASLLIVSIVAVQGQTLEAGIKSYENGNYASARSVFHALVTNAEPNATHWFWYGEALFADERFDSARIAYSQAIAIAPKDAHAYVGLGKCNLRDGRKEEAKVNFDKALDLVSGKETEIKILVAYAYISADKNSDPNAAMDVLGKAQAVAKPNSPAMAKVFEALGDVADKKMESGDAMNNYEQSLRINRSSKSVLTKMGKMWLDARVPDSSFNNLTRAIAIDATYPPAHRNMADLYFKSNQFEKAKAELDEYNKYADQTMEARKRYVAYLYKAKYYDVAITEVNKLLASEQTDVVLNRILACSYAELDKPADAELAFGRFFGIAPKEKILASDYSTFAKSLNKAGKDSLAIVMMEKAMEADNSVDFVKEIMTSYYKLKKYDAAAKFLESRLANGYKPDVNVTFIGARSYYYSGNYKMADSMNAIIIEQAPKSPTGYLGRAKAILQMDTTATLAKPFFEKYLEVVKLDDAKNKKDIITAYDYLGSYAYQKDDITAATTYFEKLLVLDPENKKAKDILAAFQNKKK